MDFFNIYIIPDCLIRKCINCASLNYKQRSPPYRQITQYSETSCKLKSWINYFYCLIFKRGHESKNITERFTKDSNRVKNYFGFHSFFYFHNICSMSKKSCLILENMLFFRVIFVQCNTHYRFNTVLFYAENNTVTVCNRFYAVVFWLSMSFYMKTSR